MSDTDIPKQSEIEAAIKMIEFYGLTIKAYAEINAEASNTVSCREAARGHITRLLTELETAARVYRQCLEHDAEKLTGELGVETTLEEGGQ